MLPQEEPAFNMKNIAHASSAEVRIQCIRPDKSCSENGLQLQLGFNNVGAESWMKKWNMSGAMRSSREGAVCESPARQCRVADGKAERAL
jgi:hypothetical protein